MANSLSDRKTELEHPELGEGVEAGNRSAAGRALAEAAARRAELDRKTRELSKRQEHDGRGGLDPVRYDDWEIAGRAVDF